MILKTQAAVSRSGSEWIPPFMLFSRFIPVVKKR